MTVLLDLVESFFISSFKLLMPMTASSTTLELNAQKILLLLISVPSKKNLGFRTTTRGLERI